MLRIRAATPADVPVLPSLLQPYTQEAFGSPWHGSAEALTRDGFGAHFHTIVAEQSSQLVGFAAWTSSYDLHHCLPGGDVLDLYVTPSRRGRGVAAALLASVAAGIHARGGRYLRGQAIDNPISSRFYNRLAVHFPGGVSIVGGGAFARLAYLAGRPPRELVRAVPPKETNYEA